MTADEIKAGLRKRALDVCQHLFPEGRQRGDEYQIGSVAGEAGRSLNININGEAGVWCDFATGDKGGNLLELWCRVRNCGIRQAMREAADWLGSPARSKNGRPKAARSKKLRPDTLPPTLRVRPHPTLGKASAHYLYLDPDNNPVVVACRFDRANGEKTFRPYDVAAGEWQEPARTSLYRVPGLLAQPDASVVMVAGEKCTNALCELGFLTTTVVGGENKVGKADLEPLRGRIVYAWRDADDAGVKWLQALTSAAANGGFELRVVPLPEGATDGVDVADLIDLEGWTAEEIRAQLDMAEPVDFKPATEDAGRFRLLTDSDLEKQPDLPDLVKGTFSAASLIVLAAQPAAGKTTLVLELAGDVGCDLLFHGRPVTAGPVIFVAAEGASKLGLRVRAWKSWRKVAQAANVYFIAEPVHFGEASEVDALLVALQKLPNPPVLVVVDTLARCMIGADENSARDVGDFVNGCDRIRRSTGAAVLIVHHTTKTGNTERGSGALRGAADTLVMMTREDDFVTVTCEKSKDAPPFEPMHFRLKVIDLGNEQTACVLDPTTKSEPSAEASQPIKLPDSRRRVFDALKDAAGNTASFASWRELARESARVSSESTFQRSVKDLLKWGMVRRKGSQYSVVEQQSHERA